LEHGHDEEMKCNEGKCSWGIIIMGNSVEGYIGEKPNGERQGRERALE